MTACQLPDPCHVKRQHAEDLAREVLALAGLRHTVCLYIDAAGVVQISRQAIPDCEPFALVGVYTRDAFVTEIVEDILAMQRELLHGKAEA